MLGAGVRVIEEADEHKLEYPQIQPFILISLFFKSARGREAQEKQNSSCSCQRLTTDSKHTRAIRLILTLSSFTGHKHSTTTGSCSELQTAPQWKRSLFYCRLLEFDQHWIFQTDTDFSTDDRTKYSDIITINLVNFSEKVIRNCY